MSHESCYSVNYYLTIECLDIGIIPFSFYADSWLNQEGKKTIAEALQALPEDEQRKAKRKFRKIKRKVMKLYDEPIDDSMKFAKRKNKKRNKYRIIKQKCRQYILDKHVSQKYNITLSFFDY